MAAIVQSQQSNETPATVCAMLNLIARAVAIEPPSRQNPVLA
jgi:hypothetical protein